MARQLVENSDCRLWPWTWRMHSRFSLRTIGPDRDRPCLALPQRRELTALPWPGRSRQGRSAMQLIHECENGQEARRRASRHIMSRPGCLPELTYTLVADLADHSLSCLCGTGNGNIRRVVHNSGRRLESSALLAVISPTTDLIRAIRHAQSSFDSSQASSANSAIPFFEDLNRLGSEAAEVAPRVRVQPKPVHESGGFRASCEAVVRPCSTVPDSWKPTFSRSTCATHRTKGKRGNMDQPLAGMTGNDRHGRRLYSKEQFNRMFAACSLTGAHWDFWIY